MLVRAVSSQQEDPRFESQVGVWEFACSPYAFVGSLWVLKLSKLTSDPELTVGASRQTLHGDLSLSWPVAFHLTPLCDAEYDKAGMENEWTAAKTTVSQQWNSMISLGYYICKKKKNRLWMFQQI